MKTLVDGLEVLPATNVTSMGTDPRRHQKGSFDTVIKHICSKRWMQSFRNKALHVVLIIDIHDPFSFYL